MALLYIKSNCDVNNHTNFIKYFCCIEWQCTYVEQGASALQITSSSNLT